MSVHNLVIRNNKEDDVLDLIQSPRAGSGKGGIDMLINPKKVSADVMSLHSYSSRSSSVSGTTESDLPPMRSSLPKTQPQLPSQGQFQFGAQNTRGFRSDAESDIDDSDGSESFQSRDRERERPREQNRYREQSVSDDDKEEHYRELKERHQKEMEEKREILFQFDRLEAKGIRLPKHYTLESDLDEMRTELHRISREKELQSSLRFQRMMVMSCITGIEFLNNKFDPLDLDLDGWSEKINYDINDYDDIFEELHDKYQSTGKKMAPELRLMMAIVGSGFQVHLQNKVFRQSSLKRDRRDDQPLPKSSQSQQQAPPKKQGMGMFDMIGSLFGIGGGGNSGGGPLAGLAGLAQSLGGQPQQGQGQAPPQQARRPPPPQENTPSEVDAILQEIHGEVMSNPTRIPPPSQRFETMSLSQSDITDLLDETPDIQSLVGAATQAKAARRGPGRPPIAAKRNTLNL